MGFDNVQEIEEDTFVPFMDDGEWLVRMGKIGRSILLIMERPVSARGNWGRDLRWLTLADDPALQKLVDKDRLVTHKSVSFSLYRIHRLS